MILSSDYLWVRFYKVPLITFERAKFFQLKEKAYMAIENTIEKDKKISLLKTQISNSSKMTLFKRSYLR